MPPASRRLLRSLAGCAVFAGLLACRESLPTLPSTDPRTCPQTYEFGNYGCFRVTGHVAPADTTAPGAATLVWLRFADTARARGISARALNPDASGSFTIQAIRFEPPLSPIIGPDTHTVQVIGQLRHQPVLTEPPRVLAADTVVVHVRLAPVGELAPVDTVQLHLTRTVH